MTFYTNIFITLPADVVKHVVGKGGANFTKMSQANNLNYMWYNKDTNAITLYGKKEILEQARINICKVIDGYVKKYAPEFTQRTYNLNTIEDICTDVSLEYVFEKESVGHLIGSEGFNFKQLTKNSGTYFIWYNSDLHAVQIYGTKFHTMKAIKLLNKKFEQVSSNMCKHKEIELLALEPTTKKQKV